MAGRIQNEDIRSVAELVSAGATAASLPNDDKIYVTANSVNKTLKQALIDGDIATSSSPVGTVVMFAGSSAPAGWLACDGSSLLRAGTYAALFSAIGTTFGSVDGTHFTIPDFRGIFPRGVGTQTISSISYTGTLGVTQGDQMQGHAHSIKGYGTDSGVAIIPTTNSGANNNGALVTGNGATIGGNQYEVTVPVTDGTHGTPRYASETRPANLGINFIIKY